MAKKVKADELPKDVHYEPPLKIEFGVNNHTVGAQRITSGRTYVPPGARNVPHIHDHAEASIYVMQGGIRELHGPEGGPYVEEDVPAGHFLYVPAGEVHGIDNLSDTEPAWLIFAYGGVPNKEAAGTRIPKDFQAQWEQHQRELEASLAAEQS